MSMESRKVELEVRNLGKTFGTGGNEVIKAVEGVSFQIYQGETFGLVGESGCGKTTCGKMCVGIISPDSGQIYYRGQNIHEMKKKDWNYYFRRTQMIFQDPYSSLDPHQTVYSIIAEGIKVQKMTTGKQDEEKQVYDLLKCVGLLPEYAQRNIHEFSGGQRQRVGIARALAVQPDFLFCDEPISALDVSIQAQIMNLLCKIQKERKLTMLFVAHDLAMVKYISDRIGVMYLGRLVETGTTEEVYDNPLHPYTQALLEAIPVADPREAGRKEKQILQGEAILESDSKGCPFAKRCRFVCDQCRMKMPEISEYEPGHYVACYKYKK